MQEELALVAIIGLIVSHYLLLKKCQVIEGELPMHFRSFENQAGVISQDISNVRALLDEALDMIAQFTPLANAVPTSQPTVAESITSLILSRLMPEMSLPDEYGTTSQQDERAIYEIDPSSSNQTEDEPHESSS